ncbi:addiction module protein [uncultured Microbacterium sp.]|uniref:addiction module protein n=1 Tax=uncultured Microbacterium sp. TaxID=191216 RepID=UPI0035C9DE3C
MTPGLAQYIEAGKSLDAAERLEAAHQLLLSVDRDIETDQSEIDAEWDEVVDRRVEQIVNGTAPLVDGPAAHARVRREIATHRE